MTISEQQTRKRANQKKEKKPGKKPDSPEPGNKNKVPLFIGIGAVVLFLIIASQWKSSNSTGNNAAAPAAPGPVLLPTINQDAIILKEIEGSWSESPSTCGFSTRDFVVGSSSNEFVIRSDGKSYRRKITSTQKLDAFTYVVFSSPVSSASESFEEHYRWASGTLRLMKRVVTPSNDLVKVFNGKNFQDGMNTPTLVKCN